MFSWREIKGENNIEENDEEEQEEVENIDTLFC